MTSTEQLRFFCAKLESSNPIESALASSGMLAAFDAISQSSTSLYDVAPVLPSLIQRLGYADMRIESFATVELDPITGEYKIDGFNATDGIALIDVDSAAVIDLEIDHAEGTLYSGQILCVGVTAKQRKLIKRTLSGELTVNHCLALIQQALPESACVCLHRH